MFADLLFQMALSSAPAGWKVPSSADMQTINDVDSLVKWMIESNPEHAEEISKKFEALKDLGYGHRD
jgi:hypothetical protein